jgi:hypothetical protein
MRPLLRVAATVTAAAAVLAGGWLPARAATSSSPIDRLRAAAHGTLHGRFGTLRFQRDGTVRFVVLECGYLPTSLGFARSFTDCSPESIVGRVEATDTGYQVTRSDGSVSHLAAYVDPRGQLHLGFGAVGQLAADRTGTVTIRPGEQLMVGSIGCTDVQGGQSRAVACVFVRDRGRTVLVYPVPDITARGGTRQAGLVLVSPYRLLVSPELVDRVYAR